MITKPFHLSSPPCRLVISWPLYAADGAPSRYLCLGALAAVLTSACAADGATIRYLSLGALAAVMRPTAVLAWLPLGLAHLISSRRRGRLMGTAILIG